MLAWFHRSQLLHDLQSSDSMKCLTLYSKKGKGWSPGKERARAALSLALPISWESSKFPGRH